MLLACLHFCFPVQAGTQQRCSCAQPGPCPESRGHCMLQVASMSPPPGNGVGDVTDNGPADVPHNSSWRENYLSRTPPRFCVLILAVPLRSPRGVRLCAPICGNQGWRHQPCVLALVFKISSAPNVTAKLSWF